MFTIATCRMNQMRAAAAFLLFGPLIGSSLRAQVPASCGETATATIRIEAGHPWCPPFGLERIGRPLDVVAELTLDGRPFREYSIVGYRGGQEIERHVLHLTRSKAPYAARAAFAKYPAEFVLLAQCRFAGTPEEVARQKVSFPPIEADALAKPETRVHPADLNAVFVPQDWLLIPAGETAGVKIAAVSHDKDREAVVKAWFGNDSKLSRQSLKLARGERSLVDLKVRAPTTAGEKEVLHLSIEDGQGQELWKKDIHAMVCIRPSGWPSFGAVETKLDYPLPISVRNPATGAFSTLDYRKGWDERFKDIVVRLPNGSRFVFWRGSSYIPFWAGQNGTGFSYEWAETTPPPDGFVDSVEPLMDKELRYGRVRIVESTPARVHVRWEYQSTDFQYKVWGDSAVEDFYFYPDGFGTRVLTLKTTPGADYELSEFIILTPPAGYPLDILPRNTVDMLFMDGSKTELLFPPPGAAAQQSYLGRKLDNPAKIPIMFRIRIHKDDDAAAIYYNPGDHGVPLLFNPFFDRGQLVTSGYWGSHWPLGRGNTTGATIDDRITITPSHNSMMTWGMGNRPEPISSSESLSLDALGRSKNMLVQRWAWLIGMTSEDDHELLARAASFGTPASLQVKGGRLDLAAYVRERRAYRVIAESPDLEIAIHPTVAVINPVFEIDSPMKKVRSIALNGQSLRAEDYAWDGGTLWIRNRIEKPITLSVQLGN